VIDRRREWEKELERLQAAGDGTPPDPQSAHRMAQLYQQLRATAPCDERCCRTWIQPCGRN
jgi:predicted nucleic acid-binding protein